MDREKEKKVTRWKITAANKVVLGIFQGTQLQAWQQCCDAMFGPKFNAKQNVKDIEPGLTFSTIDPREWKPTHVIVNGTARTEVFAEQSENYPNLVNLYTRDEWLNHEINHWDLFDGKRLRKNGAENKFAHLEKVKKS